MAFPSTFLDIQNIVTAKARLSSGDLQRVKDWINQAYYEACIETEALVSSVDVTLTAHSSSYTLPTSVARVKAMYVVPVGGIQSNPLLATTLDKILRARQASGGNIVANGAISHYALLGGNDFEVYPTPAGADVLTIYYVAFPDPLVDGGDVPVIDDPYASRMLEYGALSEAADLKGDPSEQQYRQLFEVWKQKFRTHLTRKASGQPGQFSVFPGRDFPPHDPSTDIGV